MKGLAADERDPGADGTREAALGTCRCRRFATRRAQDLDIGIPRGYDWAGLRSRAVYSDRQRTTGSEQRVLTMASLLQAIEARKLKRGNRHDMAAALRVRSETERIMREASMAAVLTFERPSETVLRAIESASMLDLHMLESPTDAARRAVEQHTALEDSIRAAAHEAQRNSVTDWMQPAEIGSSGIDLAERVFLQQQPTARPGLSLLNAAPHLQSDRPRGWVNAPSEPDVPALRNPELRLLQMLRELGAIDQPRCVKAATLAHRLYGRSKARLVDEAVSSLRKKHLVMCQRGPSGGTWLTSQGQRICALRCGPR